MFGLSAMLTKSKHCVNCFENALGKLQLSYTVKLKTYYDWTKVMIKLVKSS
jgi:hypothetical protein